MQMFLSNDENGDGDVWYIKILVKIEVQIDYCEKARLGVSALATLKCPFLLSFETLIGFSVSIYKTHKLISFSW